MRRAFTEPACRAVVAAGHLNPELALGFLKRLHEAFYAGNRDITARETLCDLAAETIAWVHGTSAEMES